jgi:hypothetical protein
MIFHLKHENERMHCVLFCVGVKLDTAQDKIMKKTA